ncbi:phosphopantetheine-binding protein [Paenibacillus chitinolyticus]|uniref:phosphopantetheine-binding protein n=1 Tax=Paenibacillus chitinolyticus TaxID=79263 RepID=UPI002DBA924E|nr:phosphopantetheine-binding protein [Paenibacillus chitinolyticus]MEC0248517.1 phosphopantetheine-binding protein [Paenibacillus chitinolyticus]
MLTIEKVIELTSSVSGRGDVTADTVFEELGLDSSGVLELLIEFEILLDTDVLNEELNLYEFEKVSDMHRYLLRLVSGE